MLGRPVELSTQLSTRLATLQHSALNYALVRFKATGLSGVSELDALLETTRCTARMLRAHGVEMPSADDSWREVSENLSSERLGNDVVRCVGGVE